MYAIGDMIPSPQFAHVAVAWGKAAVEILVRQAPFALLSMIPRCVYTFPEIAEVGLTENEAAGGESPSDLGRH